MSVLQRSTTKQIYVRRLWRLAPVVMEAEKSHNLPSAGWRTREASGIIRSQSEGPRTRSSDGQGQEEIDIPDQGEKKNAASVFLFRLAPQQIG